MPTYVAGLDFIPYAATLKQIVPQVRAEGAEVIIVTAHICSYELLALAPQAAELGDSDDWRWSLPRTLSVRLLAVSRWLKPVRI